MQLQVKDRKGQVIAEFLAYRFDQHQIIESSAAQADGFRVYDLERDAERSVFHDVSSLMEALNIISQMLSKSRALAQQTD